MSIYLEYKKRQAVTEFDSTAYIHRSEIDRLLRHAWQVTPSKNNFMAYSIHVLGPKHEDYKNLVYQNCLAKEGAADRVDASTRYSSTRKPFYSNILNCSYLLIFTMRLEDQPSLYHQDAMQRGHRFEAFDEETLDILVPSVSLEVGMFADVFGGMCVEQDLAVSHIGCFPTTMEEWKLLPFITRRPILLMTVGKAKQYKKPEPHNHRPNYNRIVNFVD
jgi:hypothetical protein